jgi:hypothetical protein
MNPDIIWRAALRRADVPRGSTHGGEPRRGRRPIRPIRIMKEEVAMRDRDL